MKLKCTRCGRKVDAIYYDEAVEVDGICLRCIDNDISIVVLIGSAITFMVILIALSSLF